MVVEDTELAMTVVKLCPHCGSDSVRIWTPETFPMQDNEQWMKCDHCFREFYDWEAVDSLSDFYQLQLEEVEV